MKTLTVLKSLIAFAFSGTIILTAHAKTQTSANGFAPFTGTWQIIDYEANDGNDADNTFQEYLPTDKKALAKERAECGIADFDYSVKQVTGKQVLKDINESMDAIKSLADEVYANDAEIAKSYKSMYTIGSNMKSRFKPNQWYWLQTQRCGDGSSATYFLSPKEAFIFSYGGGATYISKAIR